MTAPAPAPSPSIGGGTTFFCILIIAAVVVGLVVSGRTERQLASEETRILAAVPESVKPVHPSNAHGLRNVFRLGESLYTGSVPDQEHGFESLARLGIKTIISVEGAEPDVEAARLAGLRYVHLPITFGSVPHSTVVDLVRAAGELPGPIYVHCNDGRHRAPAAAIALWRCTDNGITFDEAAATMVKLGNTTDNQGLFDSIRDVKVPSRAELSAAKSDLPESTHVPPLARSMSQITRMWDGLQQSAADRDSTTIALQLTTAYDLAEQFREASALADTPAESQAGFQEIVQDLEGLAEVIKGELRSPEAASPQRAEAVDRVQQRCDQCHAKFRN